jgi:O-antigen/teichoic acid export membrane protein
LLIALAPWLTSDVLGERWQGTELLIQLLALVGIVGLFGDCTGPLFRGVGRPQWIVSVELCQSSLVIVLVWSLTGRYGAPGAAAAWLLAVGSSQLLSYFLARRILPRPLEGSVFPLALIMLASLTGAFAALAAHRLAPGVTGLLVAVPLAASVTIIVLWFCDTRFKLGLRTDLMRTFPQVATLAGFRPAATAATR